MKGIYQVWFEAHAIVSVMYATSQKPYLISTFFVVRK